MRIGMRLGEEVAQRAMGSRGHHPVCPAFEPPPLDPTSGLAAETHPSSFYLAPSKLPPCGPISLCMLRHRRYHELSTIFQA